MDKNMTSIAVLVVIVILLAFSGFNSYYNLANTEVGVIQRFGEVITTVSEPGIHFKVPFVDKVTIINVQDLRSIQYGYRIQSEATTNVAANYDERPEESLVLTKGGYMVDVGATVQYRIVHAADYLFNTDSQEETIRLAFESVLRRNMQNKNLDTALVTKEDIALEITPELQSKLDAYGLGIRIDSVKLTDVLLPQEVQEAYDNVNIAKNERDALILDAQKYENEELPQANANATVLINDARSYKETKIAQAKGDVLAFEQILINYNISKDITSTRLFIETMEKILAKTDRKFIIDMESDGNTIKYLPLSPSGLN